MTQTKLKWKCGCGAKFRTKKECEQHIIEEHGDIISHSAGLATFRYKPTKMPPEDAPEPKKPPGPMSGSAAAWLASVANESPSEATRGRAREVLAGTAQTAATKPPAGSGLQMQSSFGGGGGQTYFTGSGPKKKGKKAAKKNPKKKVKKGSGSLAAFGVMPEGQATLDEMAEELMR